MACCAFIAFLIGQCLAAFQSWRNRLARLFGLRTVPAQAAPAPRWRKGLVVALVIELGLATGGAVGAGLVRGESAWSALCSASAVLAQR
ncbi:MAG TPA: hypothetical protein VNX47_00075 [Nevskia sp.]|jgi:hypothetical protein|nr:hypothetical protein [Nevskia sp.]